MKESYNPITRRRQDMKGKYGMTLDDYDRILKSQNNRCAICNNKSVGNKRQKNLSVDHCHTTGKVRGLLCQWCNSGIGYMKDDIELLEKAIDYLKGGMI